MNFVVCINNQDYPVSLEIRKIYQVLPDLKASQHNLIRVIDESGEDYLYPANYFMKVDLPETLQKALTVANHD
ncbi:hypothetical protein [Trichothermofontia sp.]